MSVLSNNLYSGVAASIDVRTKGFLGPGANQLSTTTTIDRNSFGAAHHEANGNYLDVTVPIIFGERLSLSASLYTRATATLGIAIAGTEHLIAPIISSFAVVDNEDSHASTEFGGFAWAGSKAVLDSNGVSIDYTISAASGRNWIAPISAVPEPEPFWLLAIGLISLAFKRVKRGSQRAVYGA